MRRWGLALGCVALLVSGVVGRASATNGGPELTEVLGWDPGEVKVFFRTQYVDETARPPGILYLNLKGKDPGRLERVAWSRRELPDSAYEAKVRSLERRLKPLELLTTPTIPLYTKILRADTLNAYDDRWPRYRVRVEDRDILPGTLEVTTLFDPAVRIIRQYRIPGRRELVGIASFRAIPWEMGYEAQVPFLIPREGERRVIEWRENR